MAASSSRTSAAFRVRPCCATCSSARTGASPSTQRDLDRLAEQAVRHVVEQQLEAGVDVGNDGEQPRAGFSTYVARRMEGFGGESRRPLARDIAEHPDYRAMLDFRRRNAARVANAPQAVAEVRYTDLAEAERECDLFTRCADGAPRQFTERFMTAVSPGIAATILLNAHYDSHEQYIMALGPRDAEGVRADPRSAASCCSSTAPTSRWSARRFFQDDSLDRFLQMVELHIDAINQAIAGIPARPHPAARLLGELRRAPHARRADGGDPAAALPREGRRALPAARQSAAPARVHGAQAQPPPAGMLLLPGVIDSTTNYVEHPQVVADRICQAVDAVGDREPRHRVHGLRLRHFRRLGDRRGERRVGQAADAGARGGAGERAVCGASHS